MPQATGPKVLRIGLVQSGKVIEERVIKQRGHVTIGPSEKSLFVIPSKSIPPNFKLFELIGSDYHLNFLDGMTGRVALKTGVSDLAQLKSQAKKVPLTGASGHGYQMQLSEEARGKVVVGETTFLFQFVAPPPPTAKPQLPVSVKGGFGNEIDWRTTIIAAFSFLFHFGAIGSIYSDWMDPVVDDEVEVAQLLESVKQLPPPPPVEQPKEEVDTPVAASTAAAEAPKQASGGGKAGPGSGGGGKISDARASALSNQMAQLELQMVAALGSSGSATNSVLGASGDVPLGMLDGAAASGAGVSTSGVGGLNLGTGGGGVFRPGSVGGGGKGLAGIGDTASAGPASAGSAQKVKGPVGSAAVGGASVSGGSVANASAVVAGMAAGFRRCYNNGLKEDPNMKGSVRITARIGPNGEVLGASASGSGLSGSVIGCVQARVASASFSPPEGGGATIVIPVTFISQ
ncbi:MAG: AgmX/PglI C-terminal domain-containing protein [Polyangiaceae bacterium]